MLWLPVVGLVEALAFPLLGLLGLAAPRGLAAAEEAKIVLIEVVVVVVVAKNRLRRQWTNVMCEDQTQQMLSTLSPAQPWPTIRASHN